VRTEHKTLTGFFVLTALLFTGAGAAYVYPDIKRWRDRSRWRKRS
jgi:hypothetical protein